MPKLLQINVCSAVLSTGKIVEDISKVAIRHGWDVYTAWGRFAKTSVSTQIQVGCKVDTYFHYAAHILFDHEGLASKAATRNLVQKIEQINPDIIHLHNIHDHYINYPILFEYLAKINVPIIWTQHDCWAFTGGCMYYDLQGCNMWKSGCNNCPEHRALFSDASAMQYALKQRMFSKPLRLTYVSVSDWLSNALRMSHQNGRPILTIHNGVDISLFKPQNKSTSNKKFTIIGVAAIWDKRKGLEDFIQLRLFLPQENYEIILVGLSNEQISSLPLGIIGLRRIANMQELVNYYSSADVFVNPTYSDNFPTTNIEALACGTPVITYHTGGSSEAIDEKTGIVVPQGDIDALAQAIQRMRQKPLSSEDCRKRAEEYFDKDKCFERYIELYEQVLNG